MIDGFGENAAVVPTKDAFAGWLVQYPTTVGSRWRHEIRLLDALVAKAVESNGCPEYIRCPRRFGATPGAVWPGAYDAFLRRSRAVAICVVRIHFARRDPVVRCCAFF